VNTEKNTEKWVKGYQVPSEKSKEDAWKELKAKLPSSNRKDILPLYRKKWFYLAASVLVAAVLFTVIIDSVYDSQRYYTEGGQQKTILLTDSTIVKLNPSSELRVNYSFITGKRKLKLTGEAMFDVAPGKLFTVEFTNGKVSVLGTKFTVSAYENTSSLIKCLSGKVKVAVGKEETLLTPGEGVAINNGENLVLLNVHKQKTIDEMGGIYNWSDTPLTTVFKTIENYSGYTIYAKDEIKFRKFSGHVNLNNLNETCEVIAFAMDLKFVSNEQAKTIVFENSK
jgi:ferric-dicitrate binding protein FerR (iron transport regulator)